MSKKLTLTGWCVIVSLITCAQSQDSLQNVTQLNEVVVSASKIPLERKETAKPVQVISSQQIRNSEGKDLAQLLNEQSGIIINGAYSNPGKNKSVFVRGAGSEYTLILIDGIPITDASGFGGAFDLRLLPLQQIERIEILKGSQSTQYGSDAIAGVINIITRAPGEGTFSVQGSLSVGSLNTSEAAASVTGKKGLFGYNIGYSRFYTEGISEAQDNVDTVEFDKDSSQRNAVQANFEITPSKTLKIAPFFRYSEFDIEYDDGSFADAANTSNAKILNPGTKISYLKKKLIITGLYNFVQSDRAFNTSFSESVLKGRTHNFDAFASYSLSEKFQLIGGFYAQNAKMLDDETEKKDPSFNTFSPYFSFLASGIGGLNAELGYRLNDHSEFGDYETYSAAISYTLPFGLTVFGSYTTGFKSPNLNQLFGRFGPNPDLAPETSVSYEVGLSFDLPHKKLMWQVTYFDRSIDDVITFDNNIGYQNQDEQNDYGLEVELTYRFSPKWSLAALYNFVDGEVTEPLGPELEITFFNLIRRPKHSFVVTLNAEPFENLFVSLQGQYYGDRTDTFFNPETFATDPVDLDAYFLLNAYIEYKAIDKLSFFADFKNIIDTDFVESTGFSTLGFNLQTGIHFNL